MNCSKDDFRKAMRLTSIDLLSGIGNVWAPGAVIGTLYVAYWVIMLLTGAAVSPSDRIPVLYIGAQLFSFCVPAAVYGHINHPDDGIYHALLPLKTRVKFTAMVLTGVVIIPLAFYTCLYAADCLMAAAGGGKGFSTMIWATEDGITLSGWIADFGKICLYQSVFVLGNIVLKRHKVALSFLAMLLLHGLLLGFASIEGPLGRAVGIFSSYILPLLAWGLAYYCLKRIQYR